MIELLATEGRTSIYRLLEQPYYLIYEVRPGVRPGRVRLDLDGDVARMVLRQLADSGHLRHFYGRNCMRAHTGTWVGIEPGNLAELLSDSGHYMAVGPAPLAEGGIPGLTAQVQELSDPRDQVKTYIRTLEAAGLLNVCPPSSDWEKTFMARSLTIPEVRGILRHPIWPDGEAEGWLNEGEDIVLPPPDGQERALASPHLVKLFSALDMDPASRCMLYSYLFGAFHKCSLNDPRPLLLVDSREQQCGKSQAGEAVATLVDGTPSTLTLDRQCNESEEIVAQLANGHRCLVIPNLAHRRNWNNTLLATLCTDVGQARRIKYSAKATTFYGTLGITSMVLGTCTLHRDLITRLWRVSLTNEPRPRLDPPPQVYAARHRRALLEEIMTCHQAAIPYPDELVVTRFPEFERAGCAAYAAHSGLSHEQVSALMKQAVRGALVYRDEVMASLWVHRPEVFTDRCNWPSIPQGAEWLKDYDGAHAFGYTLKEGKWK